MDHLYADGCIGQQMWERNAQKSSSAAATEPSWRIHLRNLSNIGYISCKPGICDTIKVVVFFYGIAHGVLSQHLFNFVAVIQSLLRSKGSNMAMVEVTLASFTFLASSHHWLQSWPLAACLFACVLDLGNNCGKEMLLKKVKRGCRRTLEKNTSAELVKHWSYLGLWLWQYKREKNVHECNLIKQPESNIYTCK